MKVANFRRRILLTAVESSICGPCTFHDLRHTHAALLIAQGEHPKLIQTRFGHSSIRVTLDTYGHLFEGLDEAAANRLALEDHGHSLPTPSAEQYENNWDFTR